MRESRHTKNIIGVSSSFLVISETGQIVANCQPTGVEAIDVSFEEATANAILFAAAPTLLEACKEAFDLIDLARQYFPKSIKNNAKFKLENTCATIGKAIAKTKET